MKKVLISVCIVLVKLSVLGQVNVIGVNGLSLLTKKTLELQYEHYFQEANVSIGVDLGYRFRKNRINNTDTINLSFNRDKNVFVDPTCSGIRVTPNIKLYFKQDSETPVGGYFTVFSRYYSYNINSQLLRTINGIEETFDIKARLSSLTLGVGLGTKFDLGNNISLDVLWFGIGLGRGQTNIEFRNPDPDYEWKDLLNNFNDSQWGTWRQAKIRDIDDKLFIRTKNPFPIVFRSTISLSYVF